MSSAGDAASFKAQGNAALSAGKTDEAISFYTQGIAVAPKNHVLYSNRSAAYLKKNDYDKALEDAERCIEVKPDWPKGYSRKGTALEFKKQYELAVLAYEEGLKFCPDNELLKKGVESAKRHLTGPAGSQPVGNVGNLFGNPAEMERKLKADPRTASFFNDPSYRVLLNSMANNPQALMQNMQDQRIMTTMSVLLGIDLSNIGGAGQQPAEPPKEKVPKQEAPKPEPVKVPDTIQQSLDEKALGNAAYKKKDFETALSHYDKAFELDGKNITFLTNKAAVHFEMGDMDKCREVCHKAVEVGRENRVDYKLIAKALTRIGNSYYKEGNYEDAKKFYDKSLLENRCKETLQKFKDCEKKLETQKKLAYINPEIAIEEKNKGNEFFKKGDYPQAKKHYDESIKRNPDAAATYSNRAAVFMKLCEFSHALKDTETCIKLDPKFVKGYVRKGGCLEAMKKYTEAVDVYKKALEIDPNNNEAKQGYSRCMNQKHKNMNGADEKEIRERAMNDPEVQEILRDPIIGSILKQMEQDPSAAKEHLKDPVINKKMQKLMECGILQFR